MKVTTSDAQRQPVTGTDSGPMRGFLKTDHQRRNEVEMFMVQTNEYCIDLDKIFLRGKPIRSWDHGGEGHRDCTPLSSRFKKSRPKSRPSADYVRPRGLTSFTLHVRGIRCKDGRERP